jgi:hypothetical protein
MTWKDGSYEPEHSRRFRAQVQHARKREGFRIGDGCLRAKVRSPCAMPATACRRAYDHRMRDLVCEERDPRLFRHLGVPRSTAVSWIRRGPRIVVSADVLAMDTAGSTCTSSTPSRPWRSSSASMWSSTTPWSHMRPSPARHRMRCILVVATTFAESLPPAMRVPEQLAWSPTDGCLAELVGRSKMRPAFPISLQIRACCIRTTKCLECRDSQLWSVQRLDRHRGPGSLHRGPLPHHPACGSAPGGSRS